MAAKHIANKMTAVEGGSGMTEKEWVGGRSGCWKGQGGAAASMLQRTTEFEGNPSEAKSERLGAPQSRVPRVHACALEQGPGGRSALFNPTPVPVVVTEVPYGVATASVRSLLPLR